MTHIKKILFMSAVVLTCGAYSSSAQIYVNVRPERPVVVRTVAPSPRHVWIDEDWRERGGRYEFAGGRWEAPPHPGYRYNPGHWDHGAHGNQWRAGNWHR